jgi:twinkle protein
MNQEESAFVQHIPCESCGSSDGNSLYTDGHTHCFACHKTVQAGGSVPNTGSDSKKKPKTLISGEFMALTKRNITEETCRKFGYQGGEFKDRQVQIAPYYSPSGEMVAQKVRFPDKDFTVLGDISKAGLFGANLWTNGKKIVVTEGEIDALSVSQVQNNKWPVVSVPNGAQGAKKSLQKNLEYFDNFEEVILMFDMDEHGLKAAKECAELFPAGKCKIASLPLKDANDLLKAGREQEIIQAIWGAKTFRPDGLVSIGELKEKALVPPEIGLPWFLPSLTEATYGRRWGEVYTLGAGTGVGKTDLLTQQINYDVVHLGQGVGVFFLEQDPVETVQRIAGKSVGKLFHIPDMATKEELASAIDTLEASGKVFLYDNFGSTDWNVIKNKIRYLAHAEGIRLFYVDHLTALAAGEDDEKKVLETIMEEIASLCKSLKIIIHLVSHLATPEGKPHEEGGRVMIRHFKGSRAIGFWSHFMFGIERAQQDEEQKNRSIFRVLKDRYTGRATGLVIGMAYDADTGLLAETEIEHQFKDETQNQERDF